jgi:hypothetical protein
MDAELNVHCLVAISFSFFWTTTTMYCLTERDVRKVHGQYKAKVQSNGSARSQSKKNSHVKAEETCPKLSKKGAIQQHYKLIISIVHAPVNHIL